MSAHVLPRPARSALFVPCSTGGTFPADVAAQRRLLALAGFPDLDLLPVFCCGQPAATAGDTEGASAMGRAWAEQAARYERVFVASATCCGHLRQHAPDARGLVYAPEIWVEAIGSASSKPRIPVHLHRPCHDVWDDGRFAKYRSWLSRAAAVDVIEPPFRDPCCGFGGVFSTLFDRTAAAMMEHRLSAIAGAGARTVVSAEPGCLGHFAAHARGIEVVPLASFLVARGVGA